jgi:tRNA threonylcarbamoyladenosine biosynthesis protein TsaE
MAERFVSHSVEDTRNIGARVARSAKPGDVFALVGELGTGKTEFARGFVSAVCGPSSVRSPTFSIINIHQGPSWPVVHVDFYRLRKKEELVETGFYEYAGSEGITLVEWADMFPEALPEGARRIEFADKGNGEREITVL